MLRYIITVVSSMRYKFVIFVGLKIYELYYFKNNPTLFV